MQIYNFILNFIIIFNTRYYICILILLLPFTETCFSDEMIAYNQTGRIIFTKSCFQHYFLGQKCGIYCVGIDQFYTFKCDNGKSIYNQHNIFNLCHDRELCNKHLNLALEHATITSCKGPECTLTCEKGYELSDTMTTAKIHCDLNLGTWGKYVCNKKSYSKGKSYKRLVWLLVIMY